MAHADELGIGTMGFGGAVTMLGCKIGALNRLPASFFVSVAYNCWAFRRMGVHLNPNTGAINGWLFRDAEPRPHGRRPRGFRHRAATFHFNTPLSEADVRQLRVGDVVTLSGPLFTPGATPCTNIFPRTTAPLI